MYMLVFSRRIEAQAASGKDISREHGTIVLAAYVHICRASAILTAINRVSLMCFLLGRSVEELLCPFCTAAAVGVLVARFLQGTA